LAFYTQVNLTGLTINARRLKVGWGKHSGPLSQAQSQAIQSGASRNVYIGQITDFEKITEDKLREDFGQYGDIEMINFLRDKAAAFVNL
jgi:RNA recognition motif-containing protein